MSRMALLLLLLVMLVPGVADADPGERAAALPVALDGRPGLVVLLADDTDQGLVVPRLVVEAGDATLEVPLRDDGVRPDAAAGDQVFSGRLSPAPVARQATFTLVEGATELWRDTAPLSGSQPTLRLVYGQGGTAAVFDTDAPGPSPTAAVAPAVAAARTDRSLAVVLGALGLAVGLWLGLTLAPGLTGPPRQG